MSMYIVLLKALTQITMLCSYIGTN